jgi:hypothetical protein
MSSCFAHLFKNLTKPAKSDSDILSSRSYLAQTRLTSVNRVLAFAQYSSSIRIHPAVGPVQLRCWLCRTGHGWGISIHAMKKKEEVICA